MTEGRVSPRITGSIEETLRAELAHGDVILATAQPILRHLLANDDHALFNDEVIARVRGMMLHLARQLLLHAARADGAEDADAYATDREDALSQLLLEDAAFLGHAHALTIEAQLAGRLQARSGIDPVLTPLLQHVAAATEDGLAGAAMHVIAAQARFMQHVSRSELPLSELPAELFHAAGEALRSADIVMADIAQTTIQNLKAEFDEGKRRVGLISRLLVTLDKDARSALAIDHSGLAIFASALAMASGQPRDTVVLSLGENQFARLALSLSASGLSAAEVAKQFLFLHPNTTLPEGFDTLRRDQAASLLAASDPGALI